MSGNDFLPKCACNGLPQHSGSARSSRWFKKLRKLFFISNEKLKSTKLSLRTLFEIIARNAIFLFFVTHTINWSAARQRVNSLLKSNSLQYTLVRISEKIWNLIKKQVSKEMAIQFVLELACKCGVIKVRCNTILFKSDKCFFLSYHP